MTKNSRRECESDTKKKRSNWKERNQQPSLVAASGRIRLEAGGRRAKAFNAGPALLKGGRNTPAPLAKKSSLAIGGGECEFKEKRSII